MGETTKGPSLKTLIVLKTLIGGRTDGCMYYDWKKIREETCLNGLGVLLNPKKKKRVEWNIFIQKSHIITVT